MGIEYETLAAANKYTEDTIIGQGAIKGDKGDPGPQGPKGDTGEGVPTGGTTGQVLIKSSDANYDTEWKNAPQTGNGIVDSDGEWEVDTSKIPINYNVTTIHVGENILTSSTPVELGTGWSGDLEHGFTIANTSEPLVINVPTDTGARYLISYSTNSYVDWGRLIVGFENGESIGMYSDNNQTIRICLTSNGNPITLQSPNSNVSTTVSGLSVQKIDDNGTALDVLSQNYYTEKNDNLTGRWNTAIGYNSLSRAKEVGRTVAVGYNALGSLTIGNLNVAVGSYALPSLVKGDRNIAIGIDVMQPTTETNNNIAIGHSACSYFGSTESDNIGIGMRAFTNKHNVKTDNIGIGTQVMGGTEESGNTIAIGTQAGFHMTKNGVAIGYKAGYNRCGNNNISIGYNSNVGAGASAEADLQVTNSICLGSNSRAKKTNSIAIGCNTSAEKENQTVIGNSSTIETRVFGDFIVKGTDSVARKIVFNQDGTCSWTTP